MSNEEMPTTEEVTAPSKDDIRSKVFSGDASKRKAEIIKAFGTVIEVKQPSLGEILEVQAIAEIDSRKAVVSAIIQYCFVPGTNIRVFERTDEDGLLGLPFNADMRLINESITRMTGVDIESAEKN